MAYVSQMMLMRRMAAEDKIGANTIRDDYRDALRILQQSEGTSSPFEVQQYVAEHQTWDLNWPETPFPGIDPRSPTSTTEAPSVQNVHPLQPTKKEHQSPQSVKNEHHTQANFFSFSSSAHPQTSVRKRNPNKKAKSRHHNPQTQKRSAEKTSLQTVQHATALQTQRIAQGVEEGVSDPSWLTPGSIGSQIHPQDESNAPQAIRNHVVLLGPQSNSSFVPTYQSQNQSASQLMTVSTASPTKMQISTSDLHSVQSLLAILKKSEAQIVSNGLVEQNAAPPTSTNKDSEVQALPGQEVPHKAITAPMGLDKLDSLASSKHNDNNKEDVASMGFGRSGDRISRSSGSNYLGSFYKINPPSSFLIPNAANMASVTYSQRQRLEFSLPPSPFRNEFPTLNVLRPPGPMTIPQMLYGKSAQVAPCQLGCANCKRPGHELKDCKEPCALCDRARHTAEECTFRLR